MRSKISYYSLFLILTSLFCGKIGCRNTFAQNDSIPEAEISAALRKAGLGQDKRKQSPCNFSFFWKDGEAVNHSENAVLLNGTYIKSLIGVDYSRIHAQLKQFPAEYRTAPRDSFFLFEGRAYSSFRNYKSGKYKPKLISLWDIQKKYAPTIPLKKCVFQVNGLLLTDDLTHFRFDKDFLDTVIVDFPGQIETLDGKGTLDICFIRLYTKDFRASFAQNACRTFACETGDSLVLDTHQGLPPKTLLFVNNQNVGHFAGVDLDSLLRMNKESYRISTDTLRSPEGTTQIVHIRSEEYQPDWISLKEIAAQATGNNDNNHCLFLLNGILLDHNLQDIRIDRNYIHTVYCHKPNDIDRLNGGTHAYLQVVEIGCKDRATLEQAKGYMALGEEDIIISDYK
ncbi:MAG: hypothetical protein ACOYJE_00410 [Bacteroidaceae bacterium]|jgi:hypothetical protein